MIRSDAEYRRTLDRIQLEKEALEEQREQLAETDLSEEEVERALQPRIAFRKQLEHKVETYERLKSGELEVLRNLRSIGRWLIGARIARGWTITDLADRLDVTRQQVSRDERNEYHGISIDRAQRILETLDVQYQLNPVDSAPHPAEPERQLVAD